jgi:hypothetical protein
MTRIVMDARKDVPGGSYPDEPNASIEFAVIGQDVFISVKGQRGKVLADLELYPGSGDLEELVMILVAAAGMSLVPGDERDSPAAGEAAPAHVHVHRQVLARRCRTCGVQEVIPS